MSEFILAGRDAPAFKSLSCFAQGYVEAMFFTDASSADDGDLEDATFHDLAPETLDKIQADCLAFETANAALLDQAYEHGGDAGGYDSEAAGRDFWYTRNGHGVGFWDRGLDEIGDKLSDACRYHAVDLYRGSDGKVYL